MRLLSALVLALGLAPGCALFTTRLPFADPSMASVGALEGCWAGFHAGATMEECWGRPASGAMLGNSRALAAGLTASFEYLRIERRGEQLVYVASPQGGPSTEFVRQPSDAHSLLFENVANDFPRRIVYFVSHDVLGVRLEGVAGGEARVVEYTLKRQ